MNFSFSSYMILDNQINPVLGYNVTDTSQKFLHKLEVDARIINKRSNFNKYNTTFTIYTEIKL